MIFVDTVSLNGDGVNVFDTTKKLKIIHIKWFDKWAIFFPRMRGRLNAHRHKNHELTIFIELFTQKFTL